MVRSALAIGVLLVLAGAARADTADSHARRAQWELAVHTVLLEELDGPLACADRARMRPAPPWVHLFIDIDPDGSRGALHIDAVSTPRWLLRCLDESLPESFPAHTDATPRRAVRTLFFDDGLAEDGFSGPQQLRVPLLLGAQPERGIAGLAWDPDAEDDGDPPRLAQSSFVLTSRDAVLDVRRRLWLQALRDELDARRDALLACEVDGLLAVGVDGDGRPRLHTPANPCAAEQIASITLPRSPDGTPGRLAVYVTERGLQRTDWPGDAQVLLSEPDEQMVLRAKDRAGPSTSDCYARALNQPFQGAWEGTLSLALLLGSVGEVSEVRTAGELSGGPFSRCVARAHRAITLPAPKDGVPVLLQVRYEFSPEPMGEPQRPIPGQIPDPESPAP